MAKKQKNLRIIFGVIAFIALLYFMMSGTKIPTQAVIGTETMTRSVPLSVEKGETFTVTYDVIGASGNYFVSVVDTVTGGCTPIGEHSFFIADDYAFKQSESFTYTAPSIIGECTFIGDYKFGEFALIQFGTDTVNVVCTPSWSCSTWDTCMATCDWLDKDTCLDSFTTTGTQTRTCTDLNSCGVSCTNPSLCGNSQSCTYSCSRTVNKNTEADTDCSGTVDRTELGLYGEKWINGLVTRTELGLAGQAWAEG